MYPYSFSEKEVFPQLLALQARAAKSWSFSGFDRSPLFTNSELINPGTSYQFIIIC